MNKNIELIVGVVVFLIISLSIYLVLGGFFLYFTAWTLVFASIAIYLFSKKNIFAKLAGIFMYEGVILKILMPSKYRKQINEINKAKNDNKT